MRNAHAVADVRAAEQAVMARLPDGALMSRAAAGLAAVCAQLLEQVYGAHVVVLAGAGDNGGDALFAGARLAARGAAVTAIAAASRLHEAGAAALRSAGGTVEAAAGDAGAGAALDRADLIIDGLLGIGGHGGLREPAAALAARTEQARQSGAIVVAVDLPSGVDADTGEVAGAAVRADVTVTFGTYKPGLLIDPGASYAGAVELIDIGLSGLAAPAVSAWQAPDVAAVLPQPTAESDKYRRGVLGLLAGSQRYTGAAVLATGSAIHGGAGMVRLMSAPHAVEVALQHWPEAVTAAADPDAPAKSVETAGRVQAWAAGPGMGTDDGAAGLLAAVLAADVPALVDADGITIVSQHRELLDRSGADPDHPARRGAGPADRCRPGRHRGPPPRARHRGGRRPGRDRPAQGLDHGHRRSRRDRPGQLDGLRLAGHGRVGRRAVRPGRRAAGPGPQPPPRGRRRGLPARHRRPPGFP